MKQHTKPTPHSQSQMEKALQKFEHWRQNRAKRGPIPEYLWESAIELHDEYSVYEISKTLRLNYCRLKSRALKACETKIGSATPKQKQSNMEKVQQQFENWRKNKTQRKMPEYLWESAIELHDEYSIWEISKALRVHYSKLQNRILKACEKKADSTVPKQEQSNMKKVQQQFENWRRNRMQRKMPEYLWEAAIQLHNEYSICEIAKSLGLNFGKLKKRVLNSCETKVGSTVPKQAQSQIEKVQQQFKNWRQKQTKQMPIPEYLWSFAIQLHDQYSICEIAKALQLDDAQLKCRILKTTEKMANSPPPFIQLDIPGQHPIQREWSIEMENGDGGKMKFSTNALEISELVLICQNFLRENQ